ncbi:hypothetical protein [Neisseria yangbaofengii]|uniref:hypothetical protein n=1 Tax=Neisseria yangbaofengii TaxID=2709396 RepID=UPI0013ECF6B5|nr:hypothetical protein [Neisseria yangbaofengii]
MISEMLGDRPSESMCQKFAGRAHAALNENAEAVKNIEAALDALEIPYCAVSNSDFAKMDTTLGAICLLPRFQDKMPDLFLLAAETMGYAPQDCVVI